MALLWKVNVASCSIAGEGESELIKRRNAFSEKAHFKSQAFNIGYILWWFYIKIAIYVAKVRNPRRRNWAPKAVAFKFPNWEQLTHSQKPRAPTFYLGNCPYGSHRGISPVFIFHFYFLRTDSFIRSATKNGFSEDLARRGKRKNCSFFRRIKYSKIILIFYRLYTLWFLWNYSFSQCIKQWTYNMLKKHFILEKNVKTSQKYEQRIYCCKISLGKFAELLE